ncbi:hypothetical protein GCM10023172_24400 [Hymenobacter ginsengisoli]|uniref:Uncharacterized protein n=1 Tax=Hymenobacter ginsengisoli TaxID=1051626 RepID=A0ABP8QHB8_9BACT|nr:MULTISPECIES: hypothetical protein [unclassified Hymenobacter]MBO2033167.1 hypothetical protein [Hymenobacter sp. BT559]
MTEPTNPLFEDEKDFLERKKLEYERALRGDVEEIKETTVQVGKVALVGAGVVGGIWLLRKAFGGGKAKKKAKHKKHRSHFEDYAGFDGFDENDQELNELATDFQAPGYDDGYAGNDATSDGFYFDGQDDYFGNSDDRAYDDEADADDNGLHNYPDFPAHSASHHGNDADVLHVGEDHGDDEGPAHSYASSNSYQARPYDDSRRLPHTTSFADEQDDEEADTAPAAPKTRRSLIGPALISFAQSETGRVIVAQAAAVALALVTKAVQDFLPKYEEEAGKNADLAASSASVGVPPATWPATSAAQDATAAAHHDDTTPYREPLA